MRRGPFSGIIILKYGSTMRGMHLHHDVSPHTFSDFVHDIDYTSCNPTPGLREKIAALPGKKLIFTNATLSHAGRVLQHLGMSDAGF